MEQPFQQNDFVVPPADVNELREALTGFFMLHDTALDRPQPGAVQFRGRFIQPPEDCYDEIRTRFERVGFTPSLRRDRDRVLVIANPIVYKNTPEKWWINLVLFLATIVSTLMIGAIGELTLPEGAGAQEVITTLFSNLHLGLPFSASIMLILLAHEFGHYFAARHHKVPATLPYFIPFPFSLFGTMGAFIRIKAPITNRRALLDIGASGPLAGMLFAIPILFYGLITSEVGPLPTVQYILEGNSVLYALMKLLAFGEIYPANGVDVSLNQVAWAGWVGLFVTGFNLIPVGQLDGGHITYALMGERAKTLFNPIIGGLVLITLVNYFISGTAPWVLLIGLLFVFGRVHAEPLDDITILDPIRHKIAVGCLILFFLVFTPIPWQLVSP